MKPTAPSTPRLDDQDAEITRQAFQGAIIELQKLPSAALVVIKDVVLKDGIATPVPHGLGRPASVVVASIRGAVAAGYWNENRDTGGPDRSKFVVIKANSYGADITVDLWVM